MDDGPVVLGINRTQDASACLLRGSTLQWAIQKERLSRVKHHWGRPGDLHDYYAARLPGLDAPIDVLVECYSSDAEIANLAAYGRARGQHADAAGLDVGDADVAERLLGQTIGHWGQLDVLINTAGTDLTVPLTELAPANWLRVIGTNLNGPFFLSRGAGRNVIEAEGGHIINILLDRFPDLDTETLQDPMNVARAIKATLLLPTQSAVAESTVLPLRETSWP